MVLHGESEATWGNPTPVADRETGRVWLFLSWNTADHNQYGHHGYEKIREWGDRRLFVCFSDDHGFTWSTREDMTEQRTPKDYKWDAVGPGNGIQTVDGRIAALVEWNENVRERGSHKSIVLHRFGLGWVTGG